MELFKVSAAAARVMGSTLAGAAESDNYVSIDSGLVSKPESLRIRWGGGQAESGLALREFRDQAEREFIIRVLKKNHGNITQAALELGVGRPYLHKRLAMLGIAKTDWLL